MYSKSSKRKIKSTHSPFSSGHTMVNLNNIYEFSVNRSTFIRVIKRTVRQKDKWTARQIKDKPFQCWKQIIKNIAMI